jgi:hypothetical protein
LINSEIAAGIAVINTGKLFMQHGLKMTKWILLLCQCYQVRRDAISLRRTQNRKQTRELKFVIIA